ncbi:hypothetical protein [Cupriavidus pinatubonensis]|uniref:hypothetical protein n=1 Tax=Cupriavidus pinatubonensis TaxID=248026 RepID=UPI001FD14984|nr:hypothetical protein [Cupriavidus pinatubonensis]
MKLLQSLLQSALLATVLGFTAPAVHAEDLLDTVKASGVLKVGMEGTYPRSAIEMARASLMALTSRWPGPWQTRWASKFSHYHRVERHHRGPAGRQI